MTLYLKAAAEGNDRSWRRFRDDASLQISYVPAPGLPYALGVWSSTVSSSRVCAPAKAPVLIPTATPRLSAIARLGVAPAGVSDPGRLRVGFGVQQQRSDGSWAEVWAIDSPGSPGYVSDGVTVPVTVPAGKLVDGGTYRLSARNWSYQDDAKRYSSVVAVGCYFRVSTTVAAAPEVIQGSVYTLCPMDARSCPVSGGVDVSGSVLVSPAAGDTSARVERFRWTVGSGTTVGSLPYAQAPVSIPVRPSGGGVQSLKVWAEDSAGRAGPPTTKMINVAPLAGSVGWWPADVMSSTVVPDRGGAGVTGYVPRDLVLNGAVTDLRGRRSASEARAGRADFGLRFDGVDDWATPGAVVNSGASFTAGAWVMLTPTATDSVVMSSTNPEATVGWVLRYVASLNAFSFGTFTRGTTGGIVFTESVSSAVTRGVWLYVSGTYDVARHAARVWVNGKPATERILSSAQYPPAGSQVLTLGRVRWSSSTSTVTTGYFSGLMDEVQVWPRALTEASMSDLLDAPAPGSTEPGFARTTLFDPGVVRGVQIADSSGYDMDLLNPSRVQIVTPAQGGVASVKFSEQGALCQWGPYVSPSTSSVVMVKINLDPADLSASSRPLGSRIVLASQRSARDKPSAWSLGAVKVSSSEWRWFFSKELPDASGGVTQVMVQSDSPVVGGVDTSVAGVYRAGVDTIQVAVDGFLEGPVGRQEPPPSGAVLEAGKWHSQSGEFCVGREFRDGQWLGYFVGSVFTVKVFTGVLSDQQLSKEAGER
ncbi:MAG: LamG domain-containing protein [Kineosporiaceae bacterium]